MKVTFLGHSSFIIQIGGKSLIIDPFINDESTDISSLKCDYLLLSHGHLDHVRDAETILSNNPNAVLISNYEIVKHYSNKKIKGRPLNHGGKAEFEFGVIKYVNAIHTSTFDDGSPAGNPGGFVIWNKDESECVYFAGDTALTLDMKLIPMTCPPLTISILPLGDNFTMGYEDASIAASFIECNIVIGCHYDTFGIIKIDKSKVKEHFAKKGKILYLPAIGETINL